jgi:hypothetical protein
VSCVHECVTMGDHVASVNFLAKLRCMTSTCSGPCVGSGDGGAEGQWSPRAAVLANNGFDIVVQPSNTGGRDRQDGKVRRVCLRSVVAIPKSRSVSISRSLAQCRTVS